MIWLKNRTIIEISGPDGKKFLQGLITNDINKAGNQHLLYSAMLSPQGRFLYDFFIFVENEKIILDCHEAYGAELLKKLNFYKLRSQVLIHKNEVFEVLVSLQALSQDESNSFGDNLLAFVDPRNSNLGWRIYLKKSPQNLVNQGLVDVKKDWQKERVYHQRRIEQRIAEGFFDLDSNEAFILHFGFDELGAVDYQKGCYIGQEATARMHYRGEIRKKLYHFRINKFSLELEQRLCSISSNYPTADQSLSGKIQQTNLSENKNLVSEIANSLEVEATKPEPDSNGGSNAIRNKPISEISEKFDIVKNCEILWQEKSYGIALSALFYDGSLSGLALLKTNSQEEFNIARSGLTLLSSEIQIVN